MSLNALIFTTAFVPELANNVCNECLGPFFIEPFEDFPCGFDAIRGLDLRKGCVRECLRKELLDRVLLLGPSCSRGQVVYSAKGGIGCWRCVRGDVVVDTVVLHGPDKSIAVHCPVGTTWCQFGESDPVPFFFHVCFA